MRVLGEQLWDLKQVAWTVALQRKQGIGFELLEKIFLQSSQHAWAEDVGLVGWVEGAEDLGMEV